MITRKTFLLNMVNSHAVVMRECRTCLSQLEDKKTILNVKTMFCYGGYPGFFINTRTHKLCKGPSNTYSSNVYFQIVHWFQIGVIWKYFFLKFVLRWWPSLISVQRNQNTISVELFKFSLGAIKFIVTVIFLYFLIVHC